MYARVIGVSPKYLAGRPSARRWSKRSLQGWRVDCGADGGPTKQRDDDANRCRCAANVVATDEVLDGPRSVNLRGRPPNRLHVQKALLMQLF